MYKTATELYRYIYREVQSFMEDREAKQVSYLLCEAFFQVSRTDIVAQRELDITTEQSGSLQQALSRLKCHEPVQYILGEMSFYGREFMVNPHVLIPRPETEELVDLVIRDHKAVTPGFRLLDIGTGSGCIPVTLKKELPPARVFALDVDQKALSVARHNATKHQADITFLRADILKTVPRLAPLDVIVSNPPYVREKEKDLMAPNVLNFEPPGALFVPDQAPLIFYERITALAAGGLLKNNGWLYFEINEAFGPQIVSLMIQRGFKDVTIFKDMQGKGRIIKGYL